MTSLPKNLEALKGAVNDYIRDALDSEDEAVLEETTTKDRLEDFIRYVAILHNVNLLDVIHNVTMTKEN